MGPADVQFEQLKQKHPRATLRRNPDGTAIVEVPDVEVRPTGAWNKSQTTVRFVVPIGYPAAKPDCFWTDPDLRLSNGQLPKNTGQQPLPHSNFPTLWFSWHASAWNPNNDSLRTYLRLIQDRLSRPE
jgi:hypothetical protein